MNRLAGLTTLILMLATAGASAGNDIWQTLFKEKLREATLGDSDAQYDVGAMYQNGRGVKADRHTAIEWYQKAAGQNNSKAISRLELMASNEARFQKEQQQATSGDAESQYNLGGMYTKGVGTDIDEEQARLWYEKAANQGHIKAGYKLGLIHFEGTGVRKNSKTAIKWFKAAAEKSYAPAQYYLGKIYAAGDGVSRNYTTALQWYMRAVDGGFNQARGEMIDIQEKLRLQQSGNTVRENTQLEKKAEPVRVAKRAAAVKKTTNEEKTKTAKKPIPDKQQATPSGTTQQATIMENLMLAIWQRDDKPVAFLPSAVNNCRTEDTRIVCYSDDLSREAANNQIKYKTKSIISDFTADGSFKIMYRNLVINSTQIEDEMEAAGAGYDEEVAHGFTINTGWGKEHTLNCTLKNKAAITCLKNNTHAFNINSQQKLAESR